MEKLKPSFLMDVSHISQSPILNMIHVILYRWTFGFGTFSTVSAWMSK
jgi:hypothetical protein